MKLFVQKAFGIISHFVRSNFVCMLKYNIIKIPFILLYEIVFRALYSGFRDDHEKSLSDLCSDRPFVCPEKQEKYV